MLRVALKILGEATAEELSAFLEKTYKVRIEPKFIFILRASVRAKEMADIQRQPTKGVAEAIQVP